MATRSGIGKLMKNGSIRAVGCHWDGYPENVGKILYDYHNNEEAIDSILNLGNISSLKEKLEPTEGVNHTFDNPEDGVTIFYKRDRGEDYCNAVDFPSQIAFRQNRGDVLDYPEYFYLWKNNEWTVSNGSKGFVPLAKELDKIFKEEI